MGNAWVSQSVSHSTGKCNKTHCMGRTWEIGAHTFPMLWALFFSRFPFYGILHHMGNVCVFSLISHNLGKDSQNHRMGKVWEIGSRKYPTKPILCWEPGKLYSYFSHSISIRFTFYGILYMWNTWVSPSTSHSMGKCSEIHRIGRA